MYSVINIHEHLCSCCVYVPENLLYVIQKKQMFPITTIVNQCIVQRSNFQTRGRHSNMTSNELVIIRKSCDSGVSNIETKKAEKNPKKAVVKTLLFNVKEPAIAMRQYAKVNPLQGSVVNALDNNIGINCFPQVVRLTSYTAQQLNNTNTPSPKIHKYRNVVNLCTFKFSNILILF